MDLIESLSFLGKNGLNLAKYKGIVSEDDLEEKFPCVLKITDGHKTDIGGVVTNIKSKNELKESYRNLKKLGKSIIQQEQIDGIEIIVGIATDPAFGRTIMFGIGGIFVEVMKDVSFRICPITQKDAENMINELKAKEILYGKRGKRANIDVIEKLLVDISRLAIEFNISEMDLNPVIVNEKGYFIVDARIA